MVKTLFTFFLPLCFLPIPAGAATKKKSKVAKKAGSTIVRVAKPDSPYNEKLEAALQIRLRSKAHTPR